MGLFIIVWAEILVLAKLQHTITSQKFHLGWKYLTALTSNYTHVEHLPDLAKAWDTCSLFLMLVIHFTY